MRGRRLRPALSIALAGLAIAVGACGILPQVTSPQTDCGGTESALCDAVARVAIAEMNLTATGPITHVALEARNCRRLGAATFRIELLQAASECWRVDVQGERSGGGGVVALMRDGALQAFWETP